MRLVIPTEFWVHLSHIIVFNNMNEVSNRHLGTFKSTSQILANLILAPNVLFPFY